MRAAGTVVQWDVGLGPPPTLSHEVQRCDWYWTLCVPRGCGPHRLPDLVRPLGTLLPEEPWMGPGARNPCQPHTASQCGHRSSRDPARGLWEPSGIVSGRGPRWRLGILQDICLSVSSSPLATSELVVSMPMWGGVWGWHERLGHQRSQMRPQRPTVRA